MQPGKAGQSKVSFLTEIKKYQSQCKNYLLFNVKILPADYEYKCLIVKIGSHFNILT
jgi:hypothetical protein